jgi:hypothetical protein
MAKSSRPRATPAATLPPGGAFAVAGWGKILARWDMVPINRRGEIAPDRKRAGDECVERRDEAPWEEIRR